MSAKVTETFVAPPTTYPTDYILGSDLPDSPPLEWVIRSLFPSDGLCLIPAKSNVGKSTFIANVVASVLKSGRRNLLDYEQFVVEKSGGRVVLATFEQNYRSMTTMLDRLGVTKAQRAGLLVKVGDPAEPNLALKHFADAIDRFQPDIAIADPLPYLFDYKTTDVNDYMGMLRALSPIRRLCRRTNTCLVMAAHARKAGGDDLDAVLGSTGIGGAVDKAMLLTRHGEELTAPRTMSDIKTRLGFGEHTFPKLAFIFDWSTYRIVARPLKKGQQLDVRGEIVKRFQQSHKPLSRNDAIRKIGIRETEARREFDALVAEDVIFTVDGKLYILSPPSSDSGSEGKAPSAVVSRLVWKREMAHSSGRLITTYGPSCRTASGGTRHGRAYQQAAGRG